MTSCTRCGDPATSIDDKGRCVVCQYELQQEREWRNRNTDKVRAINKLVSRKHYAENREKILERNRESYWANRDERLESMRRRRLKNRDKINANKRAKAREKWAAMSEEEKSAVRAYQREGYASRQKERLRQLAAV